MSDTIHPTVKELAPDLAHDFPRSPRETVGGFVIAGRALDKCRAAIAGTLDEYHFDCPLDNVFFDFTGISGDDFKAAVASGKTDDGVAQWIQDKTKHLEKREIIQWNNKYRGMRISEMPIELQEFLEDYIPENIPAGKIVRCWFDIYDIEEKRI